MCEDVFVTRERKPAVNTVEMKRIKCLKLQQLVVKPRCPSPVMSDPVRCVSEPEEICRHSTNNGGVYDL
ncbi:hypothetical protein RRG08_060803 [Elysia crispata]|uniref:Uncharacterized protein n=1 Tax=Elysia crispata TaxID=231223 RepID=A0AAE1D5J2_9GAST|nr:hypothetical protein RRG08_060803 [Elysia crispata]